MQNNTKAFTLAEVLITLGIIGVVAAMTLPSVINRTQSRELETQFKKVYTELNQVAQMFKKDYEISISEYIASRGSGNSKGNAEIFIPMLMNTLTSPLTLMRCGTALWTMSLKVDMSSKIKSARKSPFLINISCTIFIPRPNLFT